MPTIRQRIAAKKLSDSIRKGKPTSMRNLLKTAGYSSNTANKPSLITKSKGWKELVDKMLPEDQLLSIHQQLLQKKEVVRLSNGKYRKTDQPHSDVKAALKMAYMVKGAFDKDKCSDDKSIVVVLTDARGKTLNQT